MPPDAAATVDRSTDEPDVVTVPEGASLETIRVGLLFTQGDVRRVERKLDRNSRMDEESRLLLHGVDGKLGTAIAAIERLEASGEGGWFGRVAGQGAAIDAAKNPGLRLVVLILAVVVGVGTLAGGGYWLWYTGDTQQGVRDRRETQVELAAQQAYDLRRLELQVKINRARITDTEEEVDSLAASDIVE